MEIENRIAKAVAEAARQGIGISRGQLLRRVGALCKQMKIPLKNGKAGKDWFDGFRKRHPELTIRKPEKLTTTRARMVNPVILKNYFDDLNTLLGSLSLADQPVKIWNCDETGKQFEHDPVKKIAQRGSRSVLGRTTSNRTNITIMACVNAVGDRMPPMFIVKGKTSRSLHGFNTEAAPAGSNWAFQDKGWMTDSLGETWFSEIFLRHCGAERPQILILDGHSSHETLAILELALEENIHIISLPPHTTHALQPLDRSVFGPLNTAYNTVCSDYLGQNPLNTVSKWTFPGLFRQAWESALSVANVVSGFRACGIFPFNPSAVPTEMIAPSLPTDVPMPVASTSAQSADDRRNDVEPVPMPEQPLLDVRPDITMNSVQDSPEESQSTTWTVAQIEPQVATTYEQVITEQNVIEDPAFLLSLIASGQCEIFSPDSDGMTKMPTDVNKASDDIWGKDINDIILPIQASVPKTATTTNGIGQNKKKTGA